MSTVLDLTSFDQIRGVLSVSSADLPDDVLAPLTLEDDLSDDLEGWLSDWESVRDGTDAKQARTLRLYAKYFCASVVAVSGQNFMYTQMTDGANGAQRSDAEGYQTLREKLEQRAQKYRDKLEQQTSGQSGGGSSEPLFGRAIPSRDPVTEGRDSAS